MKSAEVNLYYQDLELTGGNYLESILNVSLFKMRNIRLGFSSDKDKWKIIGIAEDITEMDPLDLNAGVGLKLRMKNNQKGFNFNFLRDDSKSI